MKHVRHAAASGVEREIDGALMRFIAETDAIDNHAHPVLSPPADAADRGFDALPVDNMEAETDPVGLRPESPMLPMAWKALWGVDVKAPLDEASLKTLQAARAAAKQREGEGYGQWVLQRSHVSTMLANRVAMGRGVQRPHFLWVPYDDALLFPLNNSALAAATPDRAQFFALEAKLLAAYLRDAGLPAVPATLTDYMDRVVLPTLIQQKTTGAVAIKFELAYLRSFGFSDPTAEEAARVYARWADGKLPPDDAQYKLLQDWIFRRICMEAGRLGMAVHLHTMTGGGSYFGVGGANPLLLETVFNDKRLRNTKFVMLHAGWPYVHEIGALLQKPNVYLDLSQEPLLFSPRTLSAWLREWLELFPDKVLYGTDAYPYSDSMGWEEALWMADHNERLTLGLALTGMMRDGVIDRARAESIAGGVLRGNAVALYGLTESRPAK